MPPRRRTTTTPGMRRPKVAGLAPPSGRPAGPGDASLDSPTQVLRAEPAREPTVAAGPDPVPDLGPEPTVDVAPDATAEPAAESPEEPDVAGRPAPRPSVRVLAGALALVLAAAAGLAVADHMVRSTPSAANTALSDVGTTADVAGQLGSALEAVYSYDFTRLDENERLARDVITPEFAVTFDQLFAQVRRLAPQQQAVVSATVTTAAVQSIEGDRAVLVAFLDQQATRANAGAEPQQLAAAGRLTVIGQRDGDTWRIADVLNR